MRVARALEGVLTVSLGCGVVALFAASSRASTGGRVVAPLDDAYIHLQYAASIARGEPFAYHAGEEATSGATSPLYAALLAPAAGYAPGTDVPFAVGLVLGGLALGLAALLAGHLAARVVPDPAARIAGTLVVLGWGWTGWHAASGMETIPAATLVLALSSVLVGRTVRAPRDRGPPAALLLVGLGLAAPFLRPEGAFFARAAALSLVRWPVRGRPAWGALALPLVLAPFLPGLMWRALTDRSLPNGAVAKWIPAHPFIPVNGAFRFVLGNLERLGRFLRGIGDWEGGYLPVGAGVALVAVGLVGALAVALRRRRPRDQALALVALTAAAAVLAQTTFFTFVAHRFRYPIPFLLVLVVLGVGFLGAPLRRLRPRRRGRLASRAAMLLAAASFLVTWRGVLDDYGAAAGERARLHLPMAAELRALPVGSRIAVTDAGALAWFSGRPTTDLIGLTTGDLAAEHYLGGRGSQLEWIDRLDEAERPTHLVTFERPTWWSPRVLYGRRLARFSLGRAPLMMGGSALALWRTNLAPLAPGDAPLELHGEALRVLDQIDVADLESEAAHAYRVHDDGDPRPSNVIRELRLPGRHLAEGGRIVRSRESFVLRGVAGRPLTLVLRTDARHRAALSFEVNGEPVGTVPVTPRERWTAVRCDVPGRLVQARNRVLVRRRGSDVASFHWWSAVAVDEP
ncbi:MAG: hypothetical protein ACFCGT_01130 [Sandaracinaceae bacterium]